MIGIIVPGNKKYTPYIENYIDILNADHVPYKIMSWNKNGISEANVDYSFNYKVIDYDRKRMFLGYLRFVHACKSFIRKNEIDKLIILTAAPAFFLTPRYLRKFKNRFMLDIRDDSPLIRRFPGMFQKICHMAKTVIVSSEHYSQWTGRETVLCHNADLGLLAQHKDDAVSSGRESSAPLRITYAGMMIEGDCNIRILDCFQDDPRFEFRYIGKDSPDKQRIFEYTQNHNLTNVSFEGIYEKDQIVNIYREKADLINILRDDTQVNRDAVPNKLYEAVMAGKPVLVYWHNMAIVKYVNKYHLGIVIPEDLQTKLNDYLYEEFRKFDMAEYAEGRSAFCKMVSEEMETFRKTIEQFAHVE